MKDSLSGAVMGVVSSMEGMLLPHLGLGFQCRCNFFLFFQSKVFNLCDLP